MLKSLKISHHRFSTTRHPSLENIKTVGVVGLGLMGHGVAQMVAQAGFNVYTVESQQSALDTGMKRYTKHMNILCHFTFTLYYIHKYIIELKTL